MEHYSIREAKVDVINPHNISHAQTLAASSITYFTHLY